MFLATVAQKSKFQALTNKLVKKRHWLSQEQVPDFLKQAWCEVETEVARLSEKVPELAHNEIYGAVYASWIPDQSSYSFICQALWSENGTDLSIWLDLGNADGWEFQLREYLFVTQGQVTSSAGLSVGDHMSNVWVNDIVEACQITANYAGQEFGKRNVVIEGKVMKEDNLVVLIDVYEGPENVNREPVTHHKHIELMNLPPRCQWSSP
ncbi:MAG: hypothetical protein EA405_14180 [Rhodospirillales bacterium]|nr:MAG: hypothetical protein EA405_14180 [Rhodospirillales bacterium]